MRMTERALSDWFSTETMKDDFDWSICYGHKIAQHELIKIIKCSEKCGVHAQ